MTPEDWHPEDIKAHLRKKAGTLAAFAEMRRLNPASVAATLRGRNSARVESLIADFIGVQAKDIWPSRYRSNGSRLSFRAKGNAVRPKMGAV